VALLQRHVEQRLVQLDLEQAVEDHQAPARGKVAQKGHTRGMTRLRGQQGLDNHAGIEQ
jgi:hypothetical protein